jgi:hypothetical protein
MWSRTTFALTTFAILFPLIFLAWGVALTLYNAFIGGFEIGPIKPFARKSAVLVAIVCAVLVVPRVGGWLVLAVWWIGIAVAFGMDFWEAKVLAFMIWTLTFVTWLVLFVALHGRG